MIRRIACMAALLMVTLACAGCIAPPPTQVLPVTEQPSLTPDATQPAYPVTGWIEIEEGRCCVGGYAGQQIDIHVAFGATSPAGQVTEMRLLPGCREEAQAAPWEPWAGERTFPFSPPINWVGYSLGVQYRDAQGNLSPIYCDEISVEGMPPPPTSTP
jgi:hypothetical protein